MKKSFMLFLLLIWPAGLCYPRVGDILKTIPAPGPLPTGLTFDGTHLWVAEDHTDHIYGLDPHSGKVVAKFETPGYHPEGLAWDGTHLWHVDAGEKHLYRIDPKTGRSVKALESNSPFPRDLAWDGQHLWMVDHKSDAILRVSPVDGMMIQTFASPAAEPTGITFDGKYLWIADRGTDRIYLVQPQDGLCLSSLRASGPFVYGWIPFDANKGDGKTPGDKVLGIGNVANRYIITTENGGGDRYLWFGYNYGFTWSSEGKCRIAEESYGIWSPLIKDKST